MRRTWLVLWNSSCAVSLLAACGDTRTCGAGTVEKDGVCVADDATGSGGAAATSGTGGSSTTSSSAGGAGGTGGGGPVDPGYPDYPDTIDVLSVAIRTGSGAFDGTDANGLSLCLNATACFPLDVVDIDDFRVGETDVYHFEGIDLPRAAVDRVELRSVNGTDAWRPGCMELRFDGEPVYCDDDLGALLGNGNGNGEAQTFSDPAALHQACTTCYPDTMTHGPMVGAVGDVDARLALRTDATRRVAVRLLREGESAAPIAAYVYPSPKDDFMGEVHLTGLEPDTRYQASFEIDGELAPRTASFKTMPAAQSTTGSKLRFAFGSCAKDLDQPIFDTIANTAPDAFFFVGDAHYANSPDRDSLRWFYRRSLEIPERSQLLSHTSTLAVWDDHDYVGNNTIGASLGKETALRVFSEYWANPSVGIPATPGVFFTHQMGDVEVFFLDDRYYRSPENDPSGTMLGAEQTAWLEQELSASTATFKLLVTGSMWSTTGGESWADFPGARDALFDFIRDQGVGGVVLLAGDVHRSELRWVERTAAGGYDLPELVASPLANVNSTCSANAPPDAAQVACVDDSDFFITVDVDTTAADPKLVARIVEVGGFTRGTLTVLRSQLE
jgi:alkaline phosphatase D